MNFCGVTMKRSLDRSVPEAVGVKDKSRECYYPCAASLRPPETSYKVLATTPIVCSIVASPGDTVSLV